MAGGT
ncbi:hypothetical protein ECPA34_0144, partial [Escherichia coli PA34]